MNGEGFKVFVVCMTVIAVFAMMTAGLREHEQRSADQWLMRCAETRPIEQCKADCEKLGLPCR